MAMASKTNTVVYGLICVLVYITSNHYSKAFDYNIRRLDDSNRYIHTPITGISNQSRKP
ncbi:unnamed protein product [Malus baccata var. baccata]